MVKIDPKLQSQVWQRVQGEQQNPSEQRFRLLEGEIAAQIQALMAYFPAKRPLLRQMHGEVMGNIACLQGMEVLRRGQKGPVTQGKAGGKDAAAAVRRCYVNCLNLANAYDQARSDPEYGAVFGELAQVKRRHCRALLSLLGE